MADKLIPSDSDDQDSWENLAKDLFGVEFNSPPVPADDLDDELLNDDFLKDEEEPEASDEPVVSAEPATPEEPAAQAEEVEAEAVTFSAAEEVEPSATAAGPPSHDTLDDLLDFSKPYGEEDEEEDEDAAEYGAAPETAEQAISEAPVEPNLFERLAAETEDLEDEETEEFAESDDEEFANDDVCDDEFETDDFWDVLEEFAPEELGTPHIDRGQQRGGKPPRDPEIGLVAGAPENELTESPIFETEFDTDSDFGLGVLEDVEIDEDDELEAAESDLSEEEGEEPGETRKPKRRRRRRRRGGRRRKAAAADADTEEIARDTDEEPFGDEDEELPAEDLSDEDLSDEELSDEELSDEEGEDETEASPSTGSSRYKNIPTWSEAIDLIVDRKPKSNSESRARRGNRTEPKNRKRGGRRRRSRKS